MEAQHRVVLQTFRATVSFLTNSQSMTWSCRCPASPCHSAACLQRSCVRILVRPQKIVPVRPIRPPVVRAVLSSAFPCRRKNVLRAALRRHRELNCRAASIQASRRYDNPIRIPDHGSYRAASSLRSSCPRWSVRVGAMRVGHDLEPRTPIARSSSSGLVFPKPSAVLGESWPGWAWSTCSMPRRPPFWRVRPLRPAEPPVTRRLHTAGVRHVKMTACRCEDRILPAMTSRSLIGSRRGMPAMAHGHRVLNAMLVAEK